MAYAKKAPPADRDPQAVLEMIQGMEAGKSKKKGGFKKKTFGTKSKGHTVDSWQLQDFHYKKDNLPTYARGLFIHKDGKGRPEIAVRGYDKFFNIDEVNDTKWSNIEENTRGPYELSVKENGCIIFIAGLDDETLIVTSKHSTGPRNDGDASANHALAGEAWIDKQLASLGKTQADLAKQLRLMNATAVAELCDDEFEEHVLPYSPEQAGLYLHGINVNLPQFTTYPGHLVDRFADQWGFKKTMYVVENDIFKVKDFLESVAMTGSYDGRDTEGFVIRCQARKSEQSPWYDWFFKYKFEEPYLMYRQWRECTKAIIAGKAPRVKKHKQITEEYLLYARRQLAKNPKLSKLYNANHGIIAMRDGFLAEKGLKGADIIRNELENGEEISPSSVVNNVVLVPIATLGCGKTTVALALVKLFGWGHEQNDNIVGKQRPQRFALAVTNSLAMYPVMIADRNNHQRRERQQIIEDVSKVIPEAKFVALHYAHDRLEYDDIRKHMQERVLSRGDNHQTIQADSKSREEIIGIMDGFMKRFEPCDTSREPDSAFDLVIDLEPTSSSRENLENIVSSLHDQYPSLFNMPSSEDMDDAIAIALGDYKPDIRHDLSSGSKPPKNNKSKQQAGNATSLPLSKAKPQVPEYFCISLPSAPIKSILDHVFSNHNPELNKFYKQLKSVRRIQPEFHVTLIHRASISQHADSWNELYDTWERKQIEIGRNLEPDQAAIQQRSEDAHVLGTASVQLERVVWDDRVMCIVARLINSEENGWRTVNEVAHVTVGTAADGIKPKESNDLLKRWLAGEGGETIRDSKIKGTEVLEGTVRAVMRRM